MSTPSLSFDRDLTTELCRLPYPAFLQLAQLLLERLGYTEVTAVGRTHQRGRRSNGGCDLTATLPVPGGTRRLVVQVKQYPPARRIYRKTIDELRGVCLRAGAQEAILITTGMVADPLPARQYGSATVAPVRIIDITQLPDLLARLHLGAQLLPPSHSGGTVPYTIDTAFFTELARQFPARPPRPEQLALQFMVSVTELPPKRRAARTPTRAS